MKFIDLNSKGGIGANSIYLEIGPFSLVIDSGMHPKLTGRDALPAFDKIPAQHLDAIILTHCHLDHLGALPLLARQFPNTPIITSVPSALLAPRMLHNSVSIMTLQREELGLKEYPLYTRSEIEALSQRILETPYKKTRHLESGSEELSITLYPAGHIAGAASVLLEYKHRKIFITGDISFSEQWTISGASLPEGSIDTLITETTRGQTQRDASRAEEAERLLMSINDSIESGGSVLIPVFALGRMQEMLMLFANARRENNLLDAPIFCSGLGVDLADYFDELHRRTGLVRFSRKLVKDLRARGLPEYISPHTGGVKQKGIYLISSGMVVEKTPSYGIAASLFPDPSSAILFVGYCDSDTPGGEIISMKHGERYLFDALDYEAELKARVECFDLSGHADREDLIKMARDFSPRTIVLTHGDPGARVYFKDKLNEVSKNILDPVPGETYEV